MYSFSFGIYIQLLTNFKVSLLRTGIIYCYCQPIQPILPNLNLFILASIQSKLFTILLRLINKKKFLDKQLAGNRLYHFTRPKPTSIVFETCRVHKFQVNDRNVFTLQSKNENTCSRHILYLHGGAYVQGFNKFHWQFLAWLVKATGCTVTAPDYPLAPEHTHKEAFKMVTALYEQLLLTVSPGNLILMGDSSGGGLALALAQKLRNEQIVQPSQIVLLSPWLDITLTNPEISSIAKHDPFLDKNSLRKAGSLYAGEASTNDYLLSPVNGSLEGLGRISIFIGSKEILIADARKLKSLAERNGIEIDYYEYTDMVHAWMFLSLPESKKARRQICDLIR
jgi:acetyl esterase/lipase